MSAAVRGRECDTSKGHPGRRVWGCAGSRTRSMWMSLRVMEPSGCTVNWKIWWCGTLCMHRCS